MVQLTRRALNATLAVVSFSSGGLVAVASGRAQPAAPEGAAPRSSSGANEAPSGSRDPGAEQFVRTHGRKLMSILGDASLSEAQRAAAYRAALEQTIDMRQVPDFLLGKYSSRITAKDRARFTDAFLGYARRVSAAWLKPYREDHFQIRGSRVNSPGDAIVDIEISGSRLLSPRDVSLRVLGSGENRRIVDLEYKGAWLRAIRRDEFVSTLDRANGNIEVLIARLNALPKA